VSHPLAEGTLEKCNAVLVPPDEVGRPTGSFQVLGRQRSLLVRRTQQLIGSPHACR
jgi:hypothetical protein